MKTLKLPVIQKILCSLTLFIFISFLSGASAQKTNMENTTKVRQYKTVRLTTSKPKIDGKLNDDCWQKTGEWGGNFTQWVPKEGAPPSQPTFVKVLYDNENIYVAIRAMDSVPSKIDRMMGIRDQLTGDMAGICFDSYHDFRTGFEFDLGASGHKIDAIMTNPNNADVDWDAVWYGKTALEDSAWTAEMQIPLSQLRYSNDNEQIWGMHVWRWINRLQEESDWEVQSWKGPGMLYLFGELHGISNLPKSRRIELKPFTSYKLNTYPRNVLNASDKGRKSYFNAGLDAKIGIKSNFTLDLTVNPDFGQVEADPSEINLTAFETFYKEKRPFFLEGRNIFNYNIDNNTLFYSRRIGSKPSFTPSTKDGEYATLPESATIISAEKLSGKTSKGLSLGILHSVTAAEYARISRIDDNRKEMVQPLTSYFLARVQQDFNSGNSILGGIVTAVNRNIRTENMDFLPKSAYTAGLDFLHQWKDKEFYVKGNILGSSIHGSTRSILNLQQSSARYFQRPDASHIRIDSMLKSLSGVGAKISVGKGSKGYWRYSETLNFYSPGLELNDLGYMTITDVAENISQLEYYVKEQKSVFRKYGVGVSQTNHWNSNFDYLSSELGLKTSAEFLNKWYVESKLNYTSPAIDTRFLWGGCAVKVPQRFAFSFAANTDYSKNVVFSFGSTLNKGAENSLMLYALGSTLSYRPMNTLNISVSAEHTSNNDALRFLGKETYNGEPRYLIGRLQQYSNSFTFRIDYTITPELSIQYYANPFVSIGRYNNFKRVIQPKAKDYNDRFAALNSRYDAASNTYFFDENNDEKQDYQRSNPDFSFSQFHSNLVLRWEYGKGSQIYLVWANEKTAMENGNCNSTRNIFEKMVKSPSNNVFMIKLNYWLSIF